MVHEHNITDSDKLFIIDPVSRAISTECEKLTIMQYDHNSERLTFQIQRFIEDHDMSLCDRIEIHFDNITKNKREQNHGVYLVQEIQAEEDVVKFSWLISDTATQYVGTLNFSVAFVCLDDNEQVVYTWSSDVFKSISVLSRIRNTESVLESHDDEFEQIRREILDGLDERVDAAIKEALLGIPSAEENSF